MASDQIVRKPLRARERSSRTLDQRLLLRFPRLAAASFRLIGKLPPRSRVRQAALWRAIQLAVEAYNRRDLDVVIRQRDFLDQAEALEAVGLRE